MDLESDVTTDSISNHDRKAKKDMRWNGGESKVIPTTTPKLSEMLDVPMTQVTVIAGANSEMDAHEKAVLIEELGGTRNDSDTKRKRVKERDSKWRVVGRNLCDCFRIPSELPELGTLTTKLKVDYVLQSRAIFWWTLGLLVTDFFIFMWEFNDQSFSFFKVTIFAYQFALSVIFFVQVTLTWWVRGWTTYWRDNWHLTDICLVYVSAITAMLCLILALTFGCAEDSANTCDHTYISIICNFRHLVLLRIISVVHSLSENDLRFRVNYAASELNTVGLKIVSNQITLGRRLGAGAFGEVYLGLYSGTLVAVKSLFDTETENGTSFQSEATILTLLRHPNIVLFMGVVTEPDKLWFITEYCARGSLHKLLQDETLFPPDIVTQLTLEIAVDISRGITYLHGHSSPILHRDLKAANVLVSESLEAKVADFGESIIRSKVKKASPIVGTVQYTAPEVLRAEGYTASADIYSLGMVLWQLGTHQTPFRQINPVQVGYAVSFEGMRPDVGDIPLAFTNKMVKPTSTSINHADFEVSHRRGNDVMSNYRALVQQCWAEDPTERPTAAEALSELEGILSLAGCLMVNINDESDE